MKRLLSILLLLTLFTGCGSYSAPEVVFESGVARLKKSGVSPEACACRDYKVALVELKRHSQSIVHENSFILLRDCEGKELLYCFDYWNFSRAEEITPGMKARVYLDNQGNIIHVAFILGESS